MKPKVRFKGFEGEWKRMPFSQIAERVSTYGRSGALPGVEFEDIISGEGCLNKNLSQKQCTKDGKLFQEGDVLFGKLRPYLRNIILANFKGVAIGDFWVLRGNESTHSFLYYLINSEAFIAVANVTSGSKMPRADWGYVSSAAFSLPSLPEQTTIANFFTHLDTLIASTSRRLEKLRAVKTAALQTLFPQEGEKEPRVRFKGFCGEWKEVLIGDLGTTYTGLTGKSKEDFGIGNSRYITFLNVLTNAHIDTSILEYVNVEVSERQNQVKKGDLLFNTSSEVPEEVGMCSVLDENVNNVYLNSFCFGFRIANNNVCPAFLSYLMRGGIGRHMMSILAQGSTRFNLSKRSFCNSKISLPTLPEQTAIANYFTHLDDLIASTSRRLDKLRAVKAACLEGMFV